MAVDASTARRASWERAIKNLATLNQQLDQAAQPADRDALERAIAAQQEDLLDMPAPSFGAVITKLELLWEQQLEGTHTEAEARRLVLEDLGDLIAETRQLLEAA